MGIKISDPGKLRKSLKYLFLIIVVPVLGIVSLGYGVRVMSSRGYLSHGDTVVSEVPTAHTNLTATDTSVVASTGRVTFTRPGTQVKQPPPGTKIVRIGTMSWQAGSGVLLGNGGWDTTVGSLAAKHNAYYHIELQEDGSAAQKEIAAFATEFKRLRSSGSNAWPNQSNMLTHFAIMGESYAQFAAGLNALLPSGYTAEASAPFGRSFGEDQVIADVSCLNHPDRLAGKAVACVIRDGDEDVLIAYLDSTHGNVCFNPDPLTVDPDCVNVWDAAGDFKNAALLYNKQDANGKHICEKRPIVRHGHRTGSTGEVCIAAAATWTPGDAMIAAGPFGGTSATLISTRTYSNEMAYMLVGVKQVNDELAPQLKNVYAAIYDAGDVINNTTEGRDFSAELNAKMFAPLPDLVINAHKLNWHDVYDGVQYGALHIGGSQVWNLATAVRYVQKAYEPIYTMYGNDMVRYYHNEVPSYPSYAQSVNFSLIEQLMSEAVNPTAAIVPVYNSAPFKEGEEFVKGDFPDIQFDTGSATITKKSEGALVVLYQQLNNAESSEVAIYGHTDNVGSALTNIPLSQRRAESVKKTLLAMGIAKERFVTVKGWGDTRPAADCNNKRGRLLLACQARNRRVEVLLRNSGTQSQYHAQN